MKRKIKLLISISIGIFISLLFNKVYAASASISAGKTSLEAGQSTTISVSVSQAEAWALNVSTSGGNLTGAKGFSDAMGEEVSKTVGTLTFSAQTEGTYTISMTGQVTGSDLKKMNASGSVTITVTNPAPPEEKPSNSNNGSGTSSNSGTTSKPNTNTNNKPREDEKSSNSKLDSLEIAEGAISPEFSSSVREYIINVPNEVTKLSIAAVTADSKATTRITGNEELQIGENEIEVIVTAEDGSKTTYTIKAIRAEAELGLQALNIFYIDENGEKIELTLEPIFELGTLEYTLKDISYKIEKLIVETVATRENVKIEIIGNENLKAGENIITIKVTAVMEVEAEEETDVAPPEEKIYTIKVNKEEEPVVAPLTTKQKIQNWFHGVKQWVSDNVNKIMAVLLIISTTLVIGLTIYFAYDYKNYQKLLEELARVNKTNLMEKANFALNGEEQIGENKSKIEEQENAENEITEETSGSKTEEKPEKIEERSERINEAWDKFVKADEQGKTKPEKGKRFRK